MILHPWLHDWNYYGEILPEYCNDHAECSNLRLLVRPDNNTVVKVRYDWAWFIHARVDGSSDDEGVRAHDTTVRVAIQKMWLMFAYLCYIDTRDLNNKCWHIRHTAWFYTLCQGANGWAVNTGNEKHLTWRRCVIASWL